ncbi:nicotinate phosphoribosyltransferase [Peristeroidobacter agariperforans]|uniref:nicotinate phosphoribosyltransferase n=1 Tax=Peristeroidobacter agariperforans TaxID=268404 RepID=UPI00101D385D|nr:nicotinate phosphoribosyltransferase [Peristeroidobacter agariperforans]
MTTRGNLPSVLLTDWYQLSMLDAYYRLGMTQTAVFEFFVRRLPNRRSFLIAAGLDQVLEYLENVHFTAEETAWLESTKRLSDSTLERLSSFRFTGRVFAVPEGTVFFASEPILRVEAPLPEAQLVESRIVSLLHYQTLVASKAARCRLAAPKAELIDFGMRRAHGAEAALLASRAAYIAGIDATATVEASYRYGIPPAGTMAHSFVQAHEFEADAFQNFARCHPQGIVLLIDTYDIQRGAARVVELSHQLLREGIRIHGVRIDSGDLAQAASAVRTVLDRGGCKDIRIFASGSLDEYALDAMVAARVPIDAFCLGTRLAVSEDAPSLDCAYKLQQYADRPVRKLSQSKETWPGPRQVYRQYDASGYFCMDALACEDEIIEGQPLLHEVMTNGRRLGGAPSLKEARMYCAEQLSRLPSAYRTLEHVLQAPVKVSRRQHELADQVAQIRH